MIDTKALRELHQTAKAKAINGEPQKNMIAGNVVIPTSKYWTVTRPPQWDVHQFSFHTRYEDYNDPMPVLREINMIIAKLEQLKISFIKVWENEFAPEQTKVTLEEQVKQPGLVEQHINKLKEEYKKSRAKAKTFAEIAVPLFGTMWNDSVRGPHQRLRAFGVCHQDYAELTNASIQEAIWNEGAFVGLTFKGVPIVQDDRAMVGYAVPIYKYGYEQPDEQPPILGYNNIELEPAVQQLSCGKGNHAKNCRCHEGWPIKK